MGLKNSRRLNDHNISNLFVISRLINNQIEHYYLVIGYLTLYVNNYKSSKYPPLVPLPLKILEI